MNRRERYQFGPFQLDPSERECRRGDEPIPLTGKAFDLLEFFVRDPGRTIPKAELMTALWPETAVEDSNLTQTVFLLRKALGDDSDSAVYIQTVPRMGYKFVAAVTSMGAAERAVPVPADGRKKRMQRIVGLAAIAAITATAAMLLGWGAAPRAKAHTLTPFSSEAGGNRNPVWSPDGKAVAFEVRRNESEAPQVYVRYLDASTAMQLTHDRDGGSPIAWTSTGRIVFQSSRPPEGLWTISPAGGEAEPLLGMNANAQSTAHVSADGSVVAYYDADKDGVYGVTISSPAGSPAKPYAPAPFATRTLRQAPKVKFSPDGKQILLLQAEAAREVIWLMPYPADASNPPRRVLPSLSESAWTAMVSWMPDNRRIVVGMSSGSGMMQLHMADTVSGESSVLSSGTKHRNGPAVSPDGGKLIFQEEEIDYDVVSIDLTSAKVSPLLANNHSEDLPAWAANGSAMVYRTDRTGQKEIWLHRPGEVDRPLVTPLDFPSDTTASFMNPLLSPDGSRMIYRRIARSGLAGGMWMSAVAGGDPVSFLKDEAQPGSWSPYGDWIAFLTFPDGNRWADLYKVRTTGQAHPELLKAGLKRSGSGIMPLWSPRGDWIFNDDGGPKLISQDGKTERAIGSGKVLACGFSRDGALLYCMRQERANVPGVFFSVPVDGGPEKAIGLFAPENRPQPGAAPNIRLTLTPDGRSFTYSIRKTMSNLWMMDGIE